MADTVEKVLLVDEPNFLGSLMRSAFGDVKDHIVPHKNDHRPSYRRHGIVVADLTRRDLPAKRRPAAVIRPAAASAAYL
jgi:hypothetical protein